VEYTTGTGKNIIERKKMGELGEGLEGRKRIGEGDGKDEKKTKYGTEMRKT